MLTQADGAPEGDRTVEIRCETNPRDGQTQEDWASLLTGSPDEDDLKAAFAKWREVIAKAGRFANAVRAHCGLAETQLNLGRKPQPGRRSNWWRPAIPISARRRKRKVRAILARCDRPSQGQQK